MTLLDKFAAWLRQWFSAEEVEAMFGRWPVDEGVALRGNRIMNLEEFLHLAATFAVEEVLGSRGKDVKAIIKHNEVYAVDVKTRTVVVAAAYKPLAMAANHLNSFLEEMVKQAEDARDFYMQIRSLVG